MGCAFKDIRERQQKEREERKRRNNKQNLHNSDLDKWPRHRIDP